MAHGSAADVVHLRQRALRREGGRDMTTRHINDYLLITLWRKFCERLMASPFCLLKPDLKHFYALGVTDCGSAFSGFFIFVDI